MSGSAELPSGPAPWEILLVEDDDGDAHLLSWAIRRQPFPYRLDRVESIEACLRTCDRKEFDVILLDLHLPGVQRFEGVKRISAAVPGAAIIVLTGFDDPSAAASAIRAGARGYLQKSLDADALGQAICAAMIGPATR